MSALAINACLYLYTDYDKSQEGNAASSLCILTGAFTVLLFTLLVIYGQSALGMGNHEGYLLFWKEVDSYALLGFRSFLAAMGSFVVAFLLSMKSKIPEDDQAGNVIMGISIAMAIFSTSEIGSILSLATDVIFTTDYMRN